MATSAGFGAAVLSARSGAAAGTASAFGRAMPLHQLPEASWLSLAARVERLEGLVASVGFLHRKELLQRYQTTKSTLHRWLQAGKLPAPVRFGGPLWRLADLEAAELSGQLPCPNGGLSIPIIHLKVGGNGALSAGGPPRAVQDSVRVSTCPVR